MDHKVRRGQQVAGDFVSWVMCMGAMRRGAGTDAHRREQVDAACFSRLMHAP